MLFGMAFMIFVAYAQKTYSEPNTILPKHVASIALSYCLLIAVSSGAQLQFLLDPRSLRPIAVNWRLVVTLPAYLLGIYALTLVLKLIAMRPHPTPQRRRYDNEAHGCTDPQKRSGRRAGDQYGRRENDL